ncbi:hypothetical protein LOTGIDRAFT_168050 [Lottia gigantea]|uniref:Uncharacterized protein n=1 Tax=Lottia gigantea TaxID=225164 RepID=V3Z3N0_LOTGI|nr:hypothetical protein LOTGIDRAFT_168050 [Lottia gigantea]ESO85243.1 hypothetical protein LOTGIDRAFT_168050 [Lottia gigantea]
MRTMIHNYQTNNDHKIELVWIPSDVSIPGNDQADRCAKESLSLEDIESVEYSYSEFCSIVSSRINQKWAYMLRNLDTARYHIDPKIPNHTKPSICSHLQSGNQTPDQQHLPVFQQLLYNLTKPNQRLPFDYQSTRNTMIRTSWEE